MNQIWIVYNGNYIAESYMWHIGRFCDAFAALGIEAVPVATSQIATRINGTAQIWGQEPLPEKALFWDKDVLLAQTLEQLDVALFNSRQCIACCDNKALCYHVLAAQHLPIPQTIFAPKVYQQARELDIYRNMGEVLHYPMIVKENYGSFGTGVYLIKNETQLLELVHTLGNKEYLMQEYIEASCGQDIRVIVIGGNVIAAVKRKNSQDFRANIAQGGTMEPYVLSAQEEQIALRAAAAVGADFSGVDLLKGANGDIYVCEVNSNMHFKACEEITGLNIAGYIASNICNK